LNNRKILSGIAEVCGEAQRIVDMTVAIDKLDKIGEDGVISELVQKGFSALSIDKIKPLFAFEGSNEAKLKLMRTYLAESEIGQKGLDELTEVLEQIDDLGLQNGQLVFDLTLARGLNYYTGAIFEVKAHGVKMGSICGGGRYDDLTALFGLKGLSGVGISFGADRIYDVMSELDLFAKELDRTLDLLFVNFGAKEAKYALRLLQQVRNMGLAAELYPSTAKLQKQLKYANDRNVAYVVMIGAEEATTGMLSLKNMETGAQEQLSSADFLTKCAQLF
jgi:histidyl-tRNA synthetase